MNRSKIAVGFVMGFCFVVGNLLFVNASPAPVSKPAKYARLFACIRNPVTGACEGSAGCAPGYRIVSTKASCNLSERSPARPVALLKKDTFSVDSVADKAGASCFVGDVTAKDPRRPFEQAIDPFLEPSVKIGCRGSDGKGNCRVQGEIVCETRDDAPARDMVVMTYNIHHGRTKDEVRNLEGVANVIVTEKADVVGLQEDDRFQDRTNGEDQLEILSDLTGMKNKIFVPTVEDDGQFYGNAILSKHPIRHVATIPLQTGIRRQARNAIAVRVIPYWKDSTRDYIFITTHFDSFDPADPSKGEPGLAINRFVNRPDVFTKPVVLGGDLNNDFSTLERLSSYDPAKNSISNLALKFKFDPDMAPTQIDYLMLRPRGIYQIKGWSTSLMSRGVSDHKARMVTIFTQPQPVPVVIPPVVVPWNPAFLPSWVRPITGQQP